ILYIAVRRRRSPLPFPLSLHDALPIFPPPDVLDRMRDWREMAGIALAAGIRPCSGALIVLVFALSQGLFLAGVAATLAMAFGTRSEEHTSELQSRENLVCRLLLEKKKK